MLEQKDFRSPQKAETDGADWMSSDKVFQNVEAATGNERRPTVDRRYDGTSSCSVKVGNKSVVSLL